MSSSQGITPPTTAATPQNAASKPPLKQRPKANPFMQKRPRFADRALSKPKTKTAAPTSSAPTSSQNSQPKNTAATAPAATNGTTAQNYQDFPIVISKATLENGLRYHGIRFQTKASRGEDAVINPYDDAKFTRPLHLHRRYARDKQQTAEGEDSNGVDNKETEAFNARKAERQAEREANQAQIAPGNAKNKQLKKRKGKAVEDVYYDDKDPKQQKAAQLRYEETKPWHLEDFDGKNVWVGSYQEPLSENSVLFEISDQGFRMVPVERWYSFRQTDKIAIMDSEDVEKHMSKKYLPGRWYMKTQEQNDEMRRQQAIQARQRARADDDDIKPKAGGGDYRADLDELDYEAKDEFQDDDEGLIFGDDDEDAKETEKRVRDEMREANLPATNMKMDDKDWDEADDKEKEDQKAERKLQKKLRKRIVKHEKKYEYDSDSDHPYSESSEDDDSEEERQRAEEERIKREEAQKLQANGGRSGASTQGTNTPVGRLEKRDSSRVNGSFNGLKRAGSPGLSEVSGSESRKKMKGLNGRAYSSTNLSADAARGPVSRSVGGYGSGSETDASRAGRSKKRAPASPHEGSPARSLPGSRAQSPGTRGASPSQMPTFDEIRAAIPEEGISIKELGQKFKTRISKEKTTEFAAMVKQVAVQDPVTRLVRVTARD